VSAALAPTPLEHDAWPLWVKATLGVAPGAPNMEEPASVDELREIVSACAREGRSVLAVGGASNVVGCLYSSEPCTYVSTRKLNRVLEIDVENCTVTVEAGAYGGELERALNTQQMTLGHYPQSLEISTVGGWIATRAMGTFSGRYGGIEQSLLALAAVLADGSLLETPLAPRAVGGPSLAAMFVGAEGTFGVVTRATLRIYPIAEAHVHDAWVLPSLPAALDVARRLVQHGLAPAMLRIYDDAESGALMAGQTRIEGGSALILAFEGEPEVVAAQHDAARRAMSAAGASSCTPLAVAWFERRYNAPAFLTRIREQGFIGDAIDVVVPWSLALEAHGTITAAIREHGASACYGHFSHFYHQGSSIYFIFEVEARDDEQAAQRYGEIWAAVMARAEALGLGVAHHHGIGAVRRPALASTPPVAAALAARVRDAFDPRRVLARENLRPSGAVFPAVPNVAAIPTPEGGSRG
jgi:alkyldihydroxyacetonephosphate synthase